jgi:hypothetical protein
VDYDVVMVVISIVAVFAPPFSIWIMIALHFVVYDVVVVVVSIATSILAPPFPFWIRCINNRLLFGIAS